VRSAPSPARGARAEAMPQGEKWKILRQNDAMQQTRGLGLVYQPVYLDKRTGERKTAAT